MKIYGNGKTPELSDNGNWVNWEYETPDDYTLFSTWAGALDVRVSPKGEVAVYIPRKIRMSTSDWIEVCDSDEVIT